MNKPFEQKIISIFESTKRYLETVTQEMKSGKPNKCSAIEFSIEELEHNFAQTVTAYSSFKIVIDATSKFAEQLTKNDALRAEIEELKKTVHILKTESEKLLAIQAQDSDMKKL